MWNMNKVFKKKTTKNFVKKNPDLLIVRSLKGESTNYQKNFKQSSQKCGIMGELKLGSGLRMPQVIEVTTTHKRGYSRGTRN